LHIEEGFCDRVVAVVVNIMNGVFYKMVKADARALDGAIRAGDIILEILGADNTVFAKRVADLRTSRVIAIFIDIKKRVFLFM
jgi:hypothetical protein